MHLVTTHSKLCSMATRCCCVCAPHGVYRPIKGLFKSARTLIMLQHSILVMCGSLCYCCQHLKVGDDNLKLICDTISICLQSRPTSTRDVLRTDELRLVQYGVRVWWLTLLSAVCCSRYPFSLSVGGAPLVEVVEGLSSEKVNSACRVFTCT